MPCENDYGQGGGDILRILWPHDNETWPSHMFEEDWMEGLKKGFETLFNENPEHSDEGNEESGDVASGGEFDDDKFDNEVANLAEMFGGTGTFGERAETITFWMTRRNPFLLLKKLGRDKIRKIENLKTMWGRRESIRTGNHIAPGPYAIAIMSVVCGLWLPGLKH